MLQVIIIFIVGCIYGLMAFSGYVNDRYNNAEFYGDNYIEL